MKYEIKDGIARVNDIPIGTVQAAWNGDTKGWMHARSNEWFPTELACVQSLAHIIQQAGLRLEAPQRPRQITEDELPAMAYATDEELQQALSVTGKAPQRDPSVHPTATVSSPIEWVADVENERSRRGRLMPLKRATTVKSGEYYPGID